MTLKTLLAWVVGLLIPLAACGEERLRSMALIGADQHGTLRVAASAQPGRLVLAELVEPGVSAPVYAVGGMVRYEDVQGVAYLQLDNHFGERGTFFTKTLADDGPLGKISGSSDWRPFLLPFFAESDGAILSPAKLTLSAVMPDKGTLFVRDLALYRYGAGENPLAASVEGQWFSARAGAMIGAVGGTVLGIWGAVMGVLVSRGRARGFVVTSARAITVGGICTFIAGATSFAGDQPYAVYYPLLLLGVIMVAVFGVMGRRMSRRYEELELRKIQAMDG